MKDAGAPEGAVEAEAGPEAAAGSEAADTWEDEHVPLPTGKAQELRQAANEFDMAAILDALQPQRIWEVACRTESNFGSACARRGMEVHSKTLKQGYDINKRDDVNKMLRECWQQAPWKLWFSPSCILPGTIQENLDEAKIRKKRVKVKKQLDHVVEIAAASLDNTNGTTHVYMEMPTAATGTWRSSGVRGYRQMLLDRGQKVYRTVVDECMLPSPAAALQGSRVKKQWTILHNDQAFHEKLHQPCDEGHGHQGARQQPAGEPQGPKYPKEMVDQIVAAWQGQSMKSRSAEEIRGIVATAQQIDTEMEF